MKYVIRILFFALLISGSIGFYIKSQDPIVGNRIIGITVLATSFILMPLFIYHRWKGKNVKDYLLTDDNLKKMKDFNNSKEKNNTNSL
ncbi:hypothetical protein [Aquimarina rhabdastrellae]